MRFGLRRLLGLILCLMLFAQAALAYVTLEKGDSGSDVLRMQTALTQLGYTVDCDGDFGTETRNAVKMFQRDYKLTVDGKAGNETLNKLYSLVSGTTGTTQQPSASTPSASAVQATVYCKDGGKLNLRARASTGGKVLEQIPTGEVLTIYERGSKWCYTNYAGEWGYVMTSFLVFQDSTETTTPPTTDDNTNSGTTTYETATVYCADGGKLNLRKTASSGAKVLTRIPNGTTLTILERGARWCKTTYNGETGYVMTSFLIFGAAPTNPPTTGTTTPPTTDDDTDTTTLKATVYCEDGGKLNLRARASGSAKVLEQIPTGTVLPIYEKGSTWCRTSYNGDDGYVMTKFLRFGEGDDTVVIQPTPTPSTTAPYAMVTCDNGGKLNLRSGRGTGYKVEYQIPNNAVVTVFENHGTWTHVGYGSYTGYVMTKFLTFITTATTPPSTETTPPTTETTPPSTETTPPGTSSGAMRYGEYRYATVKTSSGGTLNLRKGPGTNYSTKAEIPNGTRIVVRAIAGEWCDVYWGETAGYVKTEYLVIDAGKGDYVDTSTKYDTSILTRVLRGDETGADVNLLQTRLVELKYLSVVTGTYDSASIEAVKSFQKLHNLTVDGKAGTNTYNMLFSAEAFPYTAVTEAYQTYEIRYNSSSSTGSAEKIAAVERAQKALRALNYLCPINGDFEELTHDAIVDFQLRNGLTANGILDAATQVRLYSADAKDAASPARYYLPDDAGTTVVAPEDVSLMHWFTEVEPLIKNGDILIVYDPATGLSWQLTDLSQGRHWDVQPTSLKDTLIMRKSFGSTSWDIHVVYIMLPDGSWTMATMHNRPHGTNTIKANGFGGQNCVHFLRDMSEAQANDPSYGVSNQEALREAWYKLTGETIVYK